MGDDKRETCPACKKPRATQEDGAPVLGGFAEWSRWHREHPNVCASDPERCAEGLGGWPVIAARRGEAAATANAERDAAVADAATLREVLGFATVRENGSLRCAYCGGRVPHEHVDHCKIGRALSAPSPAVALLREVERLRALRASLPKCRACSRVATSTRRVGSSLAYWCDQHNGDDSEQCLVPSTPLPYAPAMRALDEEVPNAST